MLNLKYSRCRYYIVGSHPSETTSVIEHSLTKDHPKMIISWLLRMNQIRWFYFAIILTCSYRTKRSKRLKKIGHSTWHMHLLNNSKTPFPHNKQEQFTEFQHTNTSKFLKKTISLTTPSSKNSIPNEPKTNLAPLPYIFIQKYKIPLFLPSKIERIEFTVKLKLPSIRDQRELKPSN